MPQITKEFAERLFLLFYEFTGSRKTESNILKGIGDTWFICNLKVFGPQAKHFLVFHKSRRCSHAR